MGLFKHLRTKSRIKTDEHDFPTYKYSASQRDRLAADPFSHVPDSILRRILIEVCPHSQDFTYEPNEDTVAGDGCMLCDLRDLGACTQVCRRWYGIAQTLLYVDPLRQLAILTWSSYGSVRIDAVHFCDLEEILAKKRQRKSFRKSAVEPGDVPGVRLSLFCSTVRDSPELASRVEILKLPQMTRETSRSELARTVSVLPNLKYVDLPDGVRDGDPGCHTLATELQARCSNIRKAVYASGAESTFYSLIDGHWPRLERLYLNGMALEAGPLRNVLAMLPRLSDLTIANDDRLDDSIFYTSRPSIADFPGLKSFTMTNMPLITASGLRNYISQNENMTTLTALALNYTGITVQDLHTFVPSLKRLKSLTISDTVARPMSIQEPIASRTLQSIDFAILDDRDAHGLQPPSESYYEYLAYCIHGNELPALDEIYVRESFFPERLLSAGSPLSVPGVDNLQLDDRNGYGGPPLRKASLGLIRSLNIYSRGIDDIEYTHTFVNPSEISRGARPPSAYSVASRGIDTRWTSPWTRDSAAADNGAGAFLAVPNHDGSRPGSRPGSSHGTPGKLDILMASPAMATALRGSHGRSRSPSPSPRASRFPGSSSRPASPHVGGVSRSPDVMSNAFPSFNGRASGAYLAAAGGAGVSSPLLGHAMGGRARSESGPVLPYTNVAGSTGTSGAAAVVAVNANGMHLKTARPNFLRSRSSGPDGENNRKDRKEREDLWR